jgi:hypothetical protein
MKDKPNIKRGYMQFTYSGPGRSRNDISGVKFVPKADGPIYMLQPPLWEISEDREPGETEEMYKERKQLEQEQSIS